MPWLSLESIPFTHRESDSTRTFIGRLTWWKPMRRTTACWKDYSVAICSRIGCCVLQIVFSDPDWFFRAVEQNVVHNFHNKGSLAKTISNQKGTGIDWQ